MSLTVEQLDTVTEVNRNQWNNVVEQSELGCVSHRYEWLRAVEAGISHDAKHLVVRKKGNPIAVFPNFVTELDLSTGKQVERLRSELGLTDVGQIERLQSELGLDVGGQVERLSSIRPGYGGPITMTSEEETIELLLDTVGELCTGRILYNELRTYDQRYVRYHDLLDERGYKPVIHSCRFTLDLSQGWEPVYQGMDSERRRGIRRGHESEFEVVDEEITEDTLMAFYDGYETVAERVGQPTHPRSFFRELPRLADRLQLFTLRVDGADRGQYIHLLDDEQSTIQHLFTAVTEEHFEYRAPELLHEHAIRWGIEEGYETYELRGSPPDFRNSVFRFKEYFGAETVPSIIYERGRPAPALTALNVGRSLTRRLES